MASTAEQVGRADGMTAGTIIGDVGHPAVRRVRDILRSSAVRRRTFVIDDEENILEAVRSGVRLDSVYGTVDQQSRHAPLAAAGLTDAPFHLLADDVVAALFGTDRRSRLFALARTPPPAVLADVIARPGDIVVLDGVRLMGNVGAVIRSARAFDAAGVVLLDSGVPTVVDRRLVRSSRGTVFAMPVVLADAGELQRCLDRADIPVASLSARAPAPLSEAGLVDRRLALLMGSERRGASARMEEGAALRFHVPVSPAVESLNVSVAAAIALYERRVRMSAPAIRKTTAATGWAAVQTGPLSASG
ncbi:MULTISPECIES: TrmH family RNA methyltransferase [Microbacterium]|uniref:RNA methyltransferase n=1 Tax=Microbacterium wangchenii TaxID=2541726 RepID=A0ABX5SX04_9MICO|nr:MULTISPECIES: TrmH family RNA methyltransferase [Microbacterium]MCK6067267.1 NshR/TsnR family 23S rRNA methyltransferase [Microbacterium sp. EYE_512]QBR89787.1 RNA methyltransferase [Microbacterium wangchenii]TXK16615.1 NshR/TsnR family 23S rRNA methyltransferase [Microbacterium wangchenii]